MKTKVISSSAAVMAAFSLMLNPARSLAQPAPNLALTFDGTNDQVIVPNRAALELTDGTLELWFRPDWTPGAINYDPVLIANRLGAALTRYSLQVDRNLAGVMLANGTSVSTVPCNFTPGEWVHLALSESGPTAQVYVNGRLMGSTANGFGTLIGLPLNLGSDGAGQFFRGAMDEVRVWNIPRSAADIRLNLTRALAGTEAGLVAYWRCDEGLGLTLIDATANCFDGAVYGAAWTASPVVLINTVGSLGLALDMVASRGTHVQVNPSASLALSNQFTFEAWIKPRSAQCSTILARGNGTNLDATDYLFAVGTDGTNCGVMKLALMVGGAWAASESAVPLNAWTHVAATFDGTNRAFYLNGVLDRAVAGSGSIFQSGSPLFIGRRGTAGSNYFDGTLDEVRVWSSARSAGQIQTNVNRTVPGSEPGLIGYWRLNEQTGVGAFDSSGQRNHGTLLNRPVRLPSFRVPTLTVNGANPLLQECHITFTDQGVTAASAPLTFAAGGNHSLAQKADGRVVAWGSNSSGQTNVPASASNVVGLAAGGYHSLALTADGTIVGWGQDINGETRAPDLATNVVAVAAGGNHSLVLKTDGTVIAWGVNDYGQTNTPASASNIVAIAAGGANTLVLRADGAVIVWGRNDYGQINVPAAVANVVAVSAGGTHCLALRADGSVIAWGANGAGQSNVPTSATNVVAVSAGGAHSLALRADGTVIAWGESYYGQINVPISATNVTAIAAGATFSLAVKSDGTMINWGSSPNGNITVPPGVGTLNLTATLRGAVNSDVPGAYAWFYSTTNAVGSVAIAKRTVFVTDTKPPVLTLLGANPSNLDVGISFLDPGATASDSCAGDLTASIVRTGTVNANVPGRYTLTYTVTDPSGNTATTNRTVLVRGWPSVLGFTAFFSGTNIVTGSPVVQFLADVNPNGAATTAFAQYGLNTTYPGRTASVNLPASYDTSTFYATLDGLIPGATYHFRIAASNSLGVTYGPDQTFTVPLLFAPGDVNGDGRVDQSELNTVLSNYWPYSPWLAMTNPSAMGGGLFQFSLTNASGWNFSVLMSTNLVNWTPLPAPAWPVWQFLDPAATNQPQRFYRLHWP